MEEMPPLSKQCPSCFSKNTVKNGSVRGKIRGKRKNCHRAYTKTLPKGAPRSVKRMAAHMYLEGCGFSSVGRVLGYGKASIFRWIKEIGNGFLQTRRLAPDIPESASVMEFDELWRFVGKKNKNYGFGLLLTDLRENRSHSHAAIGIRRPS